MLLVEQLKKTMPKAHQMLLAENDVYELKELLLLAESYLTAQGDSMSAKPKFSAPQKKLQNKEDCQTKSQKTPALENTQTTMDRRGKSRRKHLPFSLSCGWYEGM